MIPVLPATGSPTHDPTHRFQLSCWFLVARTVGFKVAIDTGQLGPGSLPICAGKPPGLEMDQATCMENGERESVSSGRTYSVWSGDRDNIGLL